MAGRLEYLRGLEARLVAVEERCEERLDLVERKLYAVIESLDSHWHGGTEAPAKFADPLPED